MIARHDEAMKELMTCGVLLVNYFTPFQKSGVS